MSALGHQRTWRWKASCPLSLQVAQKFPSKIRAHVSVKKNLKSAFYRVFQSTRVNRKRTQTAHYAGSRRCSKPQNRRKVSAGRGRSMVEQVKSSKCCDQCGKPFGPKKHGGGSPQRFCSYDCRMAWHAAQRKPACTLVPKNSVSLSGHSPGNAPVNVSRDFDWTSTEKQNVVRATKNYDVPERTWFAYSAVLQPTR